MNTPKLIVLSGLPCSGKSTLAEGLAAKLKSPIFSVDPIESSIIKSGITKSFETGLAAYLIAETLASEQLKLGISVIIDAVNPVKEARDMWKQLAQKQRISLIIIECVLDENTHKQRVETRIRNMHGIPEVTWEQIEKVRKEYLPWTEERLIIDSAENVETNLNIALNYITKS